MAVEVISVKWEVRSEERKERIDSSGVGHDGLHAVHNNIYISNVGEVESPNGYAVVQGAGRHAHISIMGCLQALSQ